MKSVNETGNLFVYFPYGINVLKLNVFLANAFGLYWRLKGLFLVLQCGKSAAIYACAQEQGFEILEVSLEIAQFCC